MKSESGQSIVEFALVIPILLLLLFGIIDFGRIFHAYLTLDHAGREAARAASVGRTDAEITSKVNASAGSLDTSKLIVSISPSGSRNPGDDVTITVTYPVDFLTPVIGNLIGSFDLTDTTVMRVE